MSETALSKSEVLVLVDERIKYHDELTNEPKHSENKLLIGNLTNKLDNVIIALTRIETTATLVMKFTAGGLIIWTVRQLVELVRSFH